MKTFYLPPEEWAAPWELTGPEAHHLVTVLRARTGETVRLLDGQGHMGEFTVSEVKRKRVLLTPGELITVPQPEPRLTVAMGWAKANRRNWLLEKGVELQAAGLWFWQAAHSQGRVPSTPKPAWEQSLISGAKQCDNPWLPELRTMPTGLSDLLEASAAFDRKYLLWEDREKPVLLSPKDLTAQGEALCVVGPEGGFSPEEIKALIQAEFTPVSLGQSVLRWETAALAAMSLFWWGRHHA